MWNSASGSEYGAMSFAAKALGGLVPEDDDDEDDKKAMDQSQEDDDDEEEEEEEEVEEEPLPEPIQILAQDHDGKYAMFPIQRIPASCPVISPQILNGLDTLNDVTYAQNMAICIQPALPLIISVSPVLAFCRQKTSKQNNKSSNMPKVAYLTNWVLSATNLRQLVLIVGQGLVPFHPSVKPEFVKQSMQSFTNALERYELEVFAAALKKATSLEDFIESAEAAAFYYLNACERFLFNTIIRPHCGDSLTLAEMLTPRLTFTLTQCHSAQQQQKMRDTVVIFFRLKAQGLAERYTDKFPAMRVADDAPLYRGLISKLTLNDYWKVCQYIYL